MSGSQLFGSVVRALDFYMGRPGWNPLKDGNFFQLCFIPLLQLSCGKSAVACHSKSNALTTEPKSQLPEAVVRD